MNKIKITEFAERHFDPNFSGTKILDFSKEKIEEMINDPSVKLIPSKYDYIKYIVTNNFTSAKVGSTEITMSNYQYLRTGYSARRDGELSVLSNWFELPLSAPKANYLVFVLYSDEQLVKESWANDKELISKYEKMRKEYSDRDELDAFPDNFEDWCESELGIFDLYKEDKWGVVAILGQENEEVEPMKPVTMMRNHLGKKYGGNGEPINIEDYQKSVEFWSTHATIK